MLQHLLMLDTTEERYLGVDCESVSDRDLLTWLSEQLGVSPLHEAAVGLAPPTRRAGSKRCRNDSLRETGYRFLYPTYREGYGSLL